MEIYFRERGKDGFGKKSMMDYDIRKYIGEGGNIEEA
jgi:hypothetical protein